MDIRKFLVLILAFGLLSSCCGALSIVGRTPIQPRMILNEINIRKKMISKDDIPVSEKKSLRFRLGDKTSGYFGKMGKHVSLCNVSKYPVSRVKCSDEKGNLLWIWSTDERPYHMTLHMVIHEDKDNSLIFLLMEGYRYNPDRIVVLGEEGDTKRVFLLQGTGGFFGKRFYHFSTFLIGDEIHIVATSGGNGMGVFDSDGMMITYLKTVENPISAAGMTLRTKNGRYIAIYANHMSTSKSSVLFILSEDWKLLYKEILSSGDWMGKKSGKEGDKLIIRTSWEGTWEYSLP